MKNNNMKIFSVLLLLLSIAISSCSRSNRRTPEKRVDINMPAGIIIEKEASAQYFIIVIEKDRGIREPVIVSKLTYNDCIIGDTIVQ